MDPVTLEAFNDEMEKIALKGATVGKVFGRRYLKEMGHAAKGAYVRAPFTGKGGLTEGFHNAEKVLKRRPVHQKWLENAKNDSKAEGWAHGVLEGTLPKSIPHTFKKIPKYDKNVVGSL